MVNEKHEVAGILSLRDLVCKAGIEASILQRPCGASASLNTHVNSALNGLLRRDGSLLLNVSNFECQVGHAVTERRL